MPGAFHCTARHARVLDRSRAAPTTRRVRPGQEVRVLLRGGMRSALLHQEPPQDMGLKPVAHILGGHGLERRRRPNRNAGAKACQIRPTRARDRPRSAVALPLIQLRCMIVLRNERTMENPGRSRARWDDHEPLASFTGAHPLPPGAVEARSFVPERALYARTTPRPFGADRLGEPVSRPRGPDLGHSKVTTRRYGCFCAGGMPGFGSLTNNPAAMARARYSAMQT